MSRKRDPHSVLVRPLSGSFLHVEWNGLSGTNFYVRARGPEHARAMFDALIACPDVAGVALYVDGKFAGARDGAGS